ncbi:MAG: EF-hand domain-containing protein [Magnetococcales bacterium]|nr:EF-hand domain-containing protein [Magnetococcales bacterium]
MNMMVSGVSGMGGMMGMGGTMGVSGKGRPPAPPTADELIGKLDQNGDGALGVDEAEGPMADRFSETDTDGNGLLSSEELGAAMEAFHNEIRSRMGGGGMKGMAMGQPPSVDDLLADLDANADGVLSLDEARGPMVEDFDNADTDDDGVLSRNELEERLEELEEERTARFSQGSQEAGGDTGVMSMRNLGTLQYDLLRQLFNGEEESDNTLLTSA